MNPLTSELAKFIHVTIPKASESSYDFVVFIFGILAFLAFVDCLDSAKKRKIIDIVFIVVCAGAYYVMSNQSENAHAQERLAYIEDKAESIAAAIETQATFQFRPQGEELEIVVNSKNAGAINTGIFIARGDLPRFENLVAKNRQLPPQ